MTATSLTLLLALCGSSWSTLGPWRSTREPARPCLPAHEGTTSRAQVGAPFGPLRLPTIDGEGVVDLADLHGRVVLLIDFASW